MSCDVILQNIFSSSMIPRKICQERLSLMRFFSRVQYSWERQEPPLTGAPLKCNKNQKTIWFQINFLCLFPFTWKYYSRPKRLTRDKPHLTFVAEGYPKVLHWCLAPAIWPGARPCAWYLPLRQMPTPLPGTYPCTSYAHLCQVSCHCARRLPLRKVHTLVPGVHPCAKSPPLCPVSALLTGVYPCAKYPPLSKHLPFCQVPCASYLP